MTTTYPDHRVRRWGHGRGTVPDPPAVLAGPARGARALAIPARWACVLRRVRARWPRLHRNFAVARDILTPIQSSTPTSTRATMTAPPPPLVPAAFRAGTCAPRGRLGVRGLHQGWWPSQAAFARYDADGPDRAAVPPAHPTVASSPPSTADGTWLATRRACDPSLAPPHHRARPTTRHPFSFFSPFTSQALLQRPNGDAIVLEVAAEQYLDNNNILPILLSSVRLCVETVRRGHRGAVGTTHHSAIQEERCVHAAAPTAIPPHGFHVAAVYPSPTALGTRHPALAAMHDA